MKNFFLKNHLILIIVSLMVIVFVGGGIYSRFVTSQITFHQYKSLFTEISRIQEFTPSETVDETLFDEDTFLVKSYEAFDGNQKVGYIFVVETSGKMKGIQIAVAVDHESDSVVGVKVVQNKETPEYFALIKDNFYTQFQQYSFDKLNLTIDTVAGATMSSDAFQKAIAYAREQYALLSDFVIPNATVLIESVRYNKDFTTLSGKPVIATIHDLIQNQTMEVYLTGTFDFVEVKTPGMTQPSEAVLAELKASMQRDYAVFSQVYATTFDSASRTLTIRTRGFAGNITVVMVLNAGLTAVESASSISSFESYFDGGYGSKGDAPGLENFLFGQYLAGQEIDATAGATYTNQAMVRLFDYLSQLFAGGNGGE